MPKNGKTGTLANVNNISLQELPLVGDTMTYNFIDGTGYDQ